MRGAGAVRVARDELLALLAFVVHRVAQRARDRHQEANERDAASSCRPSADNRRQKR